MAKEFDDSTANTLENLGYVGAGVAAFLAMWASVRDNCYRQVKKMGLLDKARDMRIESLKEIGNASGPKDFFTELNKVRKSYREEIADAYKKIGINNNWDQFRMLTKMEKASVIGLALTVFSVGLGAISNIHSQRAIAQQLEALRDERDERKQR